jgi:hypothetical protein
VLANPVVPADPVVPANPVVPADPVVPANPVVPAASTVPAATTLMPTINIAAIPGATATAFSTDRVMATTELAPDSDIGAFRTTCDYSHMSFNDPIVYPGQPGKAHLHVFFGNTLTDANTTAATLVSTGNSTCRGGTVNRTGYWVPAMIDTKDGTPLTPLSLSVYYKTGYLGVKPADVKPFPAGLRMIAGDASSTVAVGTVARFSCGDGSIGWSAGIPDCQAGEGLVMSVDFPQCWDGVNLDSPDHKSHMAYANGYNITAAQLAAQVSSKGQGLQWYQALTPTAGCPPDHPVALPAISMGVWYLVPQAHAALRYRLSSDNYSASSPGGYSAHADWFNGWKSDIMNAWVTNCDDTSKDCHSHLLGDGRMIY